MRCGERRFLLLMLGAVSFCGALPVRGAGPAPAAISRPATPAANADTAADRFTGTARSGNASGRMELELLSVEGDALSVSVVFSGGIGGSGNLRGVVRRGALHLNGILQAQGAQFDIAMRASPREDGGLNGVYELSEKRTRQRQTGSFALAAIDSAAPRAALARGAR